MASSDLGIDLRQWLGDQATVTAVVPLARIHHRQVPEGYDGTYIWFGRAGLNQEKGLDETGTRPFNVLIDLEVHSFDPEEVEAVADELHLLDGHRGALGDGTCQALFIEDHTDEYEPRGVGADSGIHTAAFRVTVKGYKPAP